LSKAKPFADRPPAGAAARFRVAGGLTDLVDGLARFDGAGEARFLAVDFDGFAGARAGRVAGLLAPLARIAVLLATVNLKSKNSFHNHRTQLRWDYGPETTDQSDPRRNRSPNR